MRNISKIIIHCSATRPDMDIGAKEIRDWHVNGNGWSDIGYHFVIRRDGTIERGRDFARTGAHVRGQNTGSVGICVVGGHGSAATDAFSDHYTPEQERSLQGILETLSAVFPRAKVHGHNEFAAKACPGFDHKKWLKGKKFS